MGREAVVPVRYKGRTEERKALLETDGPNVRGEPRVVVKRPDIKSAATQDGTLKVSCWPGGVVELDLGKDAGKRASDGLDPKSRVEIPVAARKKR